MTVVAPQGVIAAGVVGVFCWAAYETVSAFRS